MSRSARGEQVPYPLVHEPTSLRDWFAGHAGEADIAEYIPTTVGGIADLLVRLGWITKKDRDADLMRCYGDAERQRLRVWAKFQYADAMLAERNK